MAEITINEISRNYTYTIGGSSFCSVALPITASWGRAFEDPASLGKTLDEVLESTVFQHYPATSDGLDQFVLDYRGPAANYRAARDYSYQIAVTLLTAGYDLDVCRVCSGAHASSSATAQIGTGETATEGTLTLRAKYPGSFGNNLVCTLNKVNGRNYWNLITYIVDSTGLSTAVENLTFTFNFDTSTDTILHVSEVESNFIDIIDSGIDVDEGVVFSTNKFTLTGGSDRKADGTAEAMMTEAIQLATERYNFNADTDGTEYIAALTSIKNANPSVSKAATIRYMEWNYNATYRILDVLTDRLAYNSKRLIMPGWDDQNFWLLTGETVNRIASLSPLHTKMMDVSYLARCMTAFIDVPKSLNRGGVWIDSNNPAVEGYAQKVSRYLPSNSIASDGLFSTHYALFGPWATYKYVGTTRSFIAPPGFLALMINLAMIKNQSLRYEWILPEDRSHNLSIGAPDYKVPRKLLDQWQSDEGISLNVITDIPDMGVTVWGNSTAFEVPPATYNVLQNLSSRFLMNAMKDVAFKAGISITFQYNNNEAYSTFYTSCSPLAETMVSAKAITGYSIQMSKDINGLDSVNANSVIGTIELYVEGVINHIKINLIAIPSGLSE